MLLILPTNKRLLSVLLFLEDKRWRALLHDAKDHPEYPGNRVDPPGVLDEATIRDKEELLKRAQGLVQNAPIVKVSLYIKTYPSSLPSEEIHNVELSVDARRVIPFFVWPTVRRLLVALLRLEIMESTDIQEQSPQQLARRKALQLIECDLRTEIQMTVKGYVDLVTPLHLPVSGIKIFLDPGRKRRV
jgi:hypothetical protein